MMHALETYCAFTIVILSLGHKKTAIHARTLFYIDLLFVLAMSLSIMYAIYEGKKSNRCMHACARSRLLDPSYSQSALALLSMGTSSPARCRAMTLLVPPTRSQPTNTPAQRVFRGHRCQRQSRAYWQAPSPSPGPGGPCPARARPRSRPGCSAATSRRRPCCSCSP